MTTQLRAWRALANTQNTASTAASQRVTLNWTLGTRAVRFTNLGTSNVFILFGDSTVTSTLTTGFCLPQGQTEIFTIGNDITHYAFIGDGTASVLYSTVGEGL